MSLQSACLACDSSVVSEIRVSDNEIESAAETEEVTEAAPLEEVGEDYIVIKESENELMQWFPAVIQERNSGADTRIKVPYKNN